MVPGKFTLPQLFHGITKFDHFGDGSAYFNADYSRREDMLDVVRMRPRALTHIYTCTPTHILARARKK